LAELAHELEALLGRGRDDGRRPTADETRELFALVDGVSRAVGGLSPPPAPAAELPAAGRAAPEEEFRTVRVDVGEMEELVRAVTETRVQLASLGREVDSLRELAGRATLLGAGSGRSGRQEGRASAERHLLAEVQAGLEHAVQALGGGVERVDQELAEVREAADRLRLVPVRTLTATLSRVAREAARALGKRVDFELSGGQLRLDAHGLGPLRDALQHVVRNAVVHGIELPEARTAAGKPVAGRVALTIRRRAERVVFSCSDDGRGVDLEAVRRELLARGGASPAEVAALSREALLERLIEVRLTTTRSVTHHSGRGIGLDVVREAAEKLGGAVTIHSEPGRGTRIDISVPLSLTSVRALLVEAEGATLAIPLDAVRETVRVTEADLRRSAQGDSMTHGGRVIPFVPLGRALGQGRPPKRAAWSAVVMSTGGRSAALGVDRLRGACDVVVRPLPRGLGADPVVAGATLDREGNPQLVLDPEVLLATALGDRTGSPAEPARKRLPILVVDDSLTTRMLEQSILESAGYEVELAVSAEQALELARARPYALFIVDVEMPGMDGFEFVARTRADPDLSRVPAILVTSRNAPEDLERGRRAGASAYIVKGEFDQNRLLSSIGDLLGGGEP
ncbi:MAG TPA: response regulator, partial [Polyangiaceae bacterium]|nr:response regulator [Polyangiaceae bacterium]